MKIIIIHGAPAVGKLTVAEALAEKTGYVILHNHMTTDVAVRFFPFGSPVFYRVIQKMRFTILEEAMKAKSPGIIWTTGLPKVPEIRMFYRKLDRYVKKHGGNTHYVHLICDLEELKRRVQSASRKRFGKLQSVKQLMKNLQEMDFTPGHVGESTIHIDNTRLSTKSCRTNHKTVSLTQKENEMKVKYAVVVTDCVDIAANELRASIINEVGDREDIIIEPFVPVCEFSIINCNYALRLMAEIYPPGTLFAVIFNPLKERPKSLIGRTEHKDLVFMGRNTGAFDWLTRDFGCAELYDTSGLFTRLSLEFQSFAGKLVTAPTIAKIARWDDTTRFGQAVPPEEIERLSLPDHTIVHIDNFGMMKFTGGLDNPQENDRYTVTINDETFDAVYCRRMMSQDTGTWVFFPGSSFGLYELGKVRQYGAQSIGAQIGDVIQFQKLS